MQQARRPCPRYSARRRPTDTGTEWDVLLDAHNHAVRRLQLFQYVPRRDGSRVPFRVIGYQPMIAFDILYPHPGLLVETSLDVIPDTSDAKPDGIVTRSQVGQR